MFIRGSVLMTAEKEKKAGLLVESNFLTVRNASPTNQPSGASFSRALKLHPYSTPINVLHGDVMVRSCMVLHGWVGVG